MSEAVSVTELYRQIGRMIRAHGADRVILMKARSDMAGTMKLEIAIDGIADLADVKNKCSKECPQVEMVIIDLNEADDEALQEAIEDGIFL